MKDHTDCRRGFHWSSRAWYADAVKESKVIFGMFHKDGGTRNEMNMIWEELGGRIVPKLGVYDDAWSALSLFTDLIDCLAEVDSQNITEEQFVTILKNCGFEDLTEYENPHDAGEIEMKDARDTLHRIVADAKEDDLERAQHTFRGLDKAMMQKEYRQSGRNRQDVLDAHLRRRREWEAANSLLNQLLIGG